MLKYLKHQPRKLFSFIPKNFEYISFDKKILILTTLYLHQLNKTYTHSFKKLSILKIKYYSYLTDIKQHR